MASRSHDRTHRKDPRWERPRDGREGLETRQGLDTVPALCEGAVPEGSKPSLTREVGLEEEEPRDQDSAARAGPRAGRRARAAGGRGCLSKGTRWRGNLANLGNRWMAGGSAPPSRPCCLRFLPPAAVYAATHPCVKTYRLQTAIIHYLAESVCQEFRRGLVRCFGFRLSHKAAVTVAPGDAVISSRGWDSLRS